MKPIAVIALLLAALVPFSFGQQAGAPLPFNGNASPFQLSQSYTFTASDSSTLAFNTNGLQYFMLAWTPNGTVSSCGLTMNGSSGGTFSSGSIIASQNCASAGGFTTSSASHTVQATLTPTITGSGSVTVVVYGFVSNPTTMNGSASNVAVTGPLGSAASAASVSVVVASDQAAVAVKNSTPANLKVDPSGVTSPVSLASVPLPTGAAQDSTLTGGTTKVRATGAAGATMDAAGQNAAAPANWLAVGCDFNTTPTTITTGNGSPCQLDAAGNLLVNLKVALPAGTNTIGSVIFPNVVGTDDPCANPHVLKSSAIISQAASTQEIVATSGSTIVYVCQATLQISGPTSPAAQIKTGTNGGTPCSASAANLSPNFIGGASATPSVIPIGSGSGMVFKSIAGGEICVTGSGTTPSVFGVITYVQQ